MKIIIENQGKQLYSFEIKQLIRLCVMIVLVLYPFWEIYWYFKVGLSFIKWHTHLLFPIYIFIPIYYLLIFLKASQKRIRQAFQLLIGIFFAEFLLVLTGLTETRQEKHYGTWKYVTEFENDTIAYYWMNRPGQLKHLKTNEFYFTRTMNSTGYSDVEWKEKKDSNEFRILCLGDSFTEGDGAHEDSCYPAFLKRKMVSLKAPVNIMNAGKCGSDPFFSYLNYKDILHKFTPNLIIQTISTNDLIDDISVRGGLERFKPDYTLVFRKPNQLIETIYAISYTSRIFFHLAGYNELLVNRWKYIRNSQTDRKKVKQLFNAYSKLTKNNKTKLLIVLLPNKYELETTYLPYLNTLKNDLLSKGYLVYDLRDYYKDYIMSNNKKIEEYYWSIDGHHNAKGYEMMSSGIFDAIKGTIPMQTISK